MASAGTRAHAIRVGTSLSIRLSVTALRAGVAIAVSVRATEQLAAGYFTAARGSALLAILAGLGTYQVVSRRVNADPLEAPAWGRWMLSTAAWRSAALGMAVGLLAALGIVAGLPPIQLGLLVLTEGIAAEVGRWQITQGRFRFANGLMLLRTALWTVPMLVMLAAGKLDQDFVPWMNLWIGSNAVAISAGVAGQWSMLASVGPPTPEQRRRANLESWRVFALTSALVAVEGMPLLAAQRLPEESMAALGLWLSMGGLVQTVYSSAVWEPMLPKLPSMPPGDAARQSAKQGMLWGAICAGGCVAGYLFVTRRSASPTYTATAVAAAAILFAQFAWIAGQAAQAALYSQGRDLGSAAVAAVSAVFLASLLVVRDPSVTGIALSYCAAHAALAALRWAISTKSRFHGISTSRDQPN